MPRRRQFGGSVDVLRSPEQRESDGKFHTPHAGKYPPPPIKYITIVSGAFRLCATYIRRRRGHLVSIVDRFLRTDTNKQLSITYTIIAFDCSLFSSSYKSSRPLRTREPLPYDVHIARSFEPAYTLHNIMFCLHFNLFKLDRSHYVTVRKTSVIPLQRKTQICVRVNYYYRCGLPFIYIFHFYTYLRHPVLTLSFLQCRRNRHARSFNYLHGLFDHENNQTIVYN